MFTDYIKGYVVIKIDGIGKERFITLCGKRSIVLKNIYMQNNVYYARLSWDEYRRIPEIVHRTAVEAVLVEKHGLPFLLSGLYKKWNMIWGLATGLCIVAILNCFIWSVEFQDLTNITTEQMERYLLEEGVDFPCFKGNVSCEKLKESMRKAFPEVSWVSASKEGCKLILRVKEQETVSGDQNTTVGEERQQVLVAQEEGKIVSMITRRGTPCKKEGDTVEKGEVLGDGDVYTYNQDGTVKNVYHYTPDADVLIEHSLQQHIKIPARKMVKEYGKKRRLFWIRIGEKEFSAESFLHPKKAMELVKDYPLQNRLLRGSSFILFGSEDVYPYTYQLVPYSDLERNNIIREKTDLMIERLQEKGVSIRQKNVTIEKNDDNWDIVVKFVLWSKQSVVQGWF